MNKSNIPSRLQQRRAMGDRIIFYVDQIVRSERYKSNPSVCFEDFRPFLTADEIDDYTTMVEERRRKEAEERAESEARAAAARKKEKEELERFLGLSLEQQDEAIKQKIQDNIAGLVDEVESSIDHNIYQFLDDRLPWSLDNDHYNWNEQFEQDTQEALAYPDGETDEDFEDSDLLSDFVSEVITVAQRHVEINFDADGFWNDKEFQARRDAFLTEVMKLRKKEVDVKEEASS
jgi:hypothetical protein